MYEHPSVVLKYAQYFSGFSGDVADEPCQIKLLSVFGETVGFFCDVIFFSPKLFSLPASTDTFDQIVQ